MTSCPKCGRMIGPDDHSQSCAACGAALAPHESHAACWTTIARLNNLAEAGFFADWLEGEGMPARVRHHHEFSALEDIWNTTFELQVSMADSQRAVAFLREALAEDPAADEMPPPAEAFSFTDRPLRGSFVGGPLLWVFMAGGLAYALGRSGWGAAPPPKRPQATLWRVIANSAPFWSEPRAGAPRRCLRFDELTSEVVVEEDLDGDGLFDTQQRFTAVH